MAEATNAHSIASDEQYAEKARLYAARCRKIMDLRRQGQHRRAAKLAAETLALEDALTLYDATNGRR